MDVTFLFADMWLRGQSWVPNGQTTFSPPFASDQCGFSTAPPAPLLKTNQTYPPGHPLNYMYATALVRMSQLVAVTLPMSFNENNPNPAVYPACFAQYGNPVAFAKFDGIEWCESDVVGGSGGTSVFHVDGKIVISQVKITVASEGEGESFVTVNAGVILTLVDIPVLSFVGPHSVPVVLDFRGTAQVPASHMLPLGNPDFPELLTYWPGIDCDQTVDVPLALYPNNIDTPLFYYRGEPVWEVDGGASTPFFVLRLNP